MQRKLIKRFEIASLLIDRVDSNQSLVHTFKELVPFRYFCPPVMSRQYRVPYVNDILILTSHKISKRDSSSPKISASPSQDWLCSNKSRDRSVCRVFVLVVNTGMVTHKSGSGNSISRFRRESRARARNRKGSALMCRCRVLNVSCTHTQL